MPAQSHQLIVPLGDWAKRAACRDLPTATFFPERGASHADAQTACAGCPVRLDCLEYALAMPSVNGVWGGASERERKTIRRRRQRAVRAERARCATSASA